MFDGFGFDLVVAAGTVFLLGTLLALRIVPLPMALALALVKVLVPLVYFGSDLAGSWILVDDLTYYRNAVALGQHTNALSVWIDPAAFLTMAALSHGFHVGYLWWNLLAHDLFGAHYYAPVFLNVVVTFGAGILLHRMLRNMGFQRGYAQMCAVFFLIHWDVLAWSSLLNIKDILVMTLLLAYVVVVQRLQMKFQWRSVAMLTAVFMALFTLRFYAIVLLLAATLAAFMLTRRQRSRWLVVGMCGVVAVVFPQGLWTLAGDLISPDIAGTIVGAFRYLVTPQPWSVAPAYSFLTLPSVAHWVMLIPVCISVVMLWRHPPTRLPILVLGVFAVFYGLVPDLQGVRQRVQLCGIIVWLQFHFLWMVARLEYAPMQWRRAVSPS